MIAPRFINAADFGKVKKAWDRKSRTVLYRTGAYGRAVMRNKVRRRRRSSGPNEAPSAHTRPGLKAVFFAVDPANTEVTISPLVFSKQPPGLSGAGSVPELLERGGRQLLKGRESGRLVWADYLPRPFVLPTLPDTRERMGKLIESTPLK